MAGVNRPWVYPLAAIFCARLLLLQPIEHVVIVLVSIVPDALHDGYRGIIDRLCRHANTALAGFACGQAEKIAKLEGQALGD